MRIRFLITALAAMVGSSAFANSYMVTLNTPYNPNSTPATDASTGPLYATFSDITSGTYAGDVKLVMSIPATSLVAGGYVAQWDFNLNSAANLSGLKIVTQLGGPSYTGFASGYTAGAPSTADGNKYLYGWDIKFGNKNFIDGNTATFVLADTKSSMDALDFVQQATVLASTLYTFTPDQNTPFISVADCLVASGKYAGRYDWEGGTKVPDGGTTSMLLGVSMLGLGWLRRAAKR